MGKQIPRDTTNFLAAVAHGEMIPIFATQALIIIGSLAAAGLGAPAAPAPRSRAQRSCAWHRRGYLARQSGRGG